MMRVNLLPHREIRRKRQQQQFLSSLALVALKMVGVLKQKEVIGLVRTPDNVLF